MMNKLREINSSLKFQSVKDVKFSVTYDLGVEILRVDFKYRGHALHGNFATDDLEREEVINYVKYVKNYIRCYDKTIEKGEGKEFLYKMLDGTNMDKFFKRAGQPGTYSPQRVTQDMITMQMLQ